MNFWNIKFSKRFFIYINNIERLIYLYHLVSILGIRESNCATGTIIGPTSGVYIGGIPKNFLKRLGGSDSRTKVNIRSTTHTRMFFSCYFCDSASFFRKQILKVADDSQIRFKKKTCRLFFVDFLLFYFLIKIICRGIHFLIFSW